MGCLEQDGFTRCAPFEEIKAKADALDISYFELNLDSGHNLRKVMETIG